MNDFRPSAVEMRDLRLVLAIVDSGGLTRASEQLNVTQSALSHQLRQLESSLGVELFARIKKRLVLTAAGEELAERARPIVHDLSALEEDLRRRSAGWHGTLRIATECYTLYEWLPPLLQRFHKRHRDVEVRIVADATSDPLAALQNGAIDLAIATTVPRDRRIATRELFRDEMLLITAPKHPLAQKKFVRASDLRNERLLLYTPPSENLFHQQFFKGVEVAGGHGDEADGGAAGDGSRGPRRHRCRALGGRGRARIRPPRRGPPRHARLSAAPGSPPRSRRAGTSSPST